MEKKPWKIELAPKYKVDQLVGYIEIVLEALGHSEALVTDESTIWDFHPLKKDQAEWLKKINDKLGFEVSLKDRLWEVAEQVRAKQWKEGANED